MNMMQPRRQPTQNHTPTMKMMRTAVLSLLLAASSRASFLRPFEKKEEPRQRRTEGGGNTACGNINPELMAYWDISAADCDYADQNRDDSCVTGPIVIPGNPGCQTAEDCSLAEPLDSCIVAKDPDTGNFADTYCGSLASVATALGVQEYALAVICPGDIQP